MTMHSSGWAKGCQLKALISALHRFLAQIPCCCESRNSLGDRETSIMLELVPHPFCFGNG